MCSPLLRALMSNMAVAFVDEDRCQDARLAASASDDGCYPIGSPCVQVVPVQAVVSQLLWDVSGLRCEVAMAQSQVSYLAAMLASCARPIPQALAPQPQPSKFPAGTSAERPFANIALRKISNKKVARCPAVTSTIAPAPAKVEPAKLSDASGAFSLIKALSLEPANGTTPALGAIAGRKVGNKKLMHHVARKAAAPKSNTKKFDQRLVRFQPLHLVTSDDLGRRLLEHRAVAYAQGNGPNDSGSTSSGSECGTECDSENGDVCILCLEPALHTCPSGCGSFCQTCHEAHEYDGRHWCP